LIWRSDPINNAVAGQPRKDPALPSELDRAHGHDGHIHARTILFRLGEASYLIHRLRAVPLDTLGGALPVFHSPGHEELLTWMERIEPGFSAWAESFGHRV
jgi:hypothetical protein